MTRKHQKRTYSTQ